MNIKVFAIVLVFPAVVCAEHPLDRGYNLLQQGKIQQARVEFVSAIDTSFENDVANTVAYWFIFTIDYSLNQTIENDLSAFIFSAQNVEDQTFIDEFRLHNKISTAKAILEFIYSTKHNTGHKVTNPIVLKADEIPIFLTLVECKGKQQTLNAPVNGIQHVTVKCGTKTTEYYFGE